MALGIKIKNLKFKNSYTFEELLEKMKTVTFEGGEPFIAKHGFNSVITFPPIDRQNQVWIMSGRMGESSDKWSVQLSHDIAGDFGNMVKNEVLNKLTDGFAGLGAMFGKNAKAGEAAVDEVVKKLTEMDL